MTGWLTAAGTIGNGDANGMIQMSIIVGVGVLVVMIVLDAFFFGRG